MNFTLYYDVILLKNIEEESLFSGGIGTVVDIHNVNGLETGHTVEFFDLLGNTRAVVTLLMSYFPQPTKSDIPKVKKYVPPLIFALRYYIGEERKSII